jgi:HEAT repeat protein
MKKILITIFMSLLMALSFFGSVNAQEPAEQLIEKYLHDNGCAGKYDCQSPFFNKIAEQGIASVQPLLNALNDRDLLYAQHRLDFIYLLGEIGDARAYTALRDILLGNQRDEDQSGKWRVAISLGACLDEENIDDYVALAVQDQTGGVLKALREMSGQDFGQNIEQWVEYLKRDGNLDLFRAQCRGRSKPILG